MMGDQSLIEMAAIHMFDGWRWDLQFVSIKTFINVTIAGIIIIQFHINPNGRPLLIRAFEFERINFKKGFLFDRFIIN